MVECERVCHQRQHLGVIDMNALALFCLALFCLALSRMLMVDLYNPITSFLIRLLRQRMVLKEEQYGLGINQVFITMNPVLLGFVKRNYRAYCPTRGAQGGGGGGARTLPVSLQYATPTTFLWDRPIFESTSL